MQRFGVRATVAYIAPSLVIWVGTYAAGVHPTIAGVVIGLLRPGRPGSGRKGLSRVSVRKSITWTMRRRTLCRLTSSPEGSVTLTLPAGKPCLPTRA
jgi:Na+/H+ antiporter NhaA